MIKLVFGEIMQIKFHKKCKENFVTDGNVLSLFAICENFDRMTTSLKEPNLGNQTSDTLYYLQSKRGNKNC